MANDNFTHSNVAVVTNTAEKDERIPASDTGYTKDSKKNILRGFEDDTKTRRRRENYLTDS